MTECNQCKEHAAKIERLTSNLEYAAARFETQVAYTKEIENQLRAHFGAAQVRGLQHWLGVTGSVMEDESWEKLDEKTRRLYVLDLVRLAAE